MKMAPLLMILTVPFAPLGWTSDTSYKVSLVSVTPPEGMTDEIQSSELRYGLRLISQIPDVIEVLTVWESVRDESGDLVIDLGSLERKPGENPSLTFDLAQFERHLLGPHSGLRQMILQVVERDTFTKDEVLGEMRLHQMVRAGGETVSRTLLNPRIFNGEEFKAVAEDGTQYVLVPETPHEQAR